MLEKILINLDVGPAGALLRIAMGFGLVIMWHASGHAPGAWAAVFSLVAMLFGMKVAAVVGRRIVPATSVVRAHWEWRRNLARYHDSYQWRKLVWFGIGLLLGATLERHGGTIQWILGLTCVLAGAVAEIFWRRQGLGLAPPRTA